MDIRTTLMTTTALALAVFAAPTARAADNIDIHVVMRIGSAIASAMTARSASLSDAGSRPVTSIP